MFFFRLVERIHVKYTFSFHYWKSERNFLNVSNQLGMFHGNIYEVKRL